VRANVDGDNDADGEAVRPPSSYSGSVTKHARFAPSQLLHVPQMAKSSPSAQSSLLAHGLHTGAALTQNVPPSTEVAQNPDPLLQRGASTPQEFT
jgi:hypothetical protein